MARAPRGDIRSKKAPLKTKIDPFDCCELMITGNIQQECAVMEAIERKLESVSNLSVQANPQVNVNSAASAAANAAVSVDASAVAPTPPGTPATSSDAQAIPDAKADPKSDATATSVNDSRLSQSIIKEQALVSIAIKYCVEYDVCHSQGCVRVSGVVLDDNQNLIYNFQSGKASGKVQFMTVGVYDTTQPFPNGVFSLHLECLDQCGHTASFDDHSPQLLLVP